MTPDRPTSGINPPDVLCGYHLMEHIGGGGVADVYRGVRVDGGPDVAVKVLRDPERSQAVVRRFLREGHLLRSFEHAGLPRCFDVFSSPRPVLVLELLKGWTLAEAIRGRGTLPAEEVTRIASELLRVLGFLHQRGVVHRDIKSSNVYLNGDGRTMLVDLGLAVDPMDPFTTTLGDVVGTYAYMAPEQIAGAGVDQRADLYSLGITLYEALAGTRPFKASGSVGYLKAHKKGRFTHLSHLVPEAPSGLVELVQHLMARDPSARPASAGVALAMLTGVGGIPHEIRAPPLVGREGARGAIEAVLDGGGFIQLVGEVGAGTGRAAQLALERAREMGIESLAVRCRRAGAQHQIVSQVTAGLSLVLREEVQASTTSMLDALLQLAGEGGFLLLLEDTHLADEASFETLARVLEGVPGLAVVATGLYACRTLPGRVVSLRPLEREEVGALLAGMLGTDPSIELLNLVARESGGMPALAVLIVRSLHSRGALRPDGIGEHGEPRWLLDTAAVRTSIFGLRSSFDALLSSLGGEALAVLQVLSLAGERVPLGVAVEAAGADPSGLDVAKLVKLGLVALESDEEDDWVRVRRPVVASMVVEDLPLERRARFHRELAAALARLEPGPWQGERFALHQALGSPVREAVPALLGLAARVLAAGEHRRALDTLQLLHDLPSDDPDTTAEAAILHGEALLSGERWMEARDPLLAGRELASDLGRRELTARALIGLSRYYLLAGDTPQCESLAVEVLRSAADIPPASPYVAVAWLQRGICATWRGAERESLRYLRRAAGLALARRHREVLSEARFSIGVAYAEVDRLEHAWRYLKQELERLRTSGERGPRGLVCFHLSMVERQRGSLQRAWELAREGEDAGRRTEQTHVEILNGVARAHVQLSLGDVEGAGEGLRQLRAESTSVSAFTLLHYNLLQALIRTEQGDRQAALAAFDDALEVARRMEHTVIGAFCAGMSAVMTANARNLGESIDVLGRCGGRRYLAILLLAGATLVGDAATLSVAAQEARHARDLMLLLKALHALGGEEARVEAAGIASRLRSGAGPILGPILEACPAVLWAARS